MRNMLDQDYSQYLDCYDILIVLIANCNIFNLWLY